mmetsp:Transcript_6333/g.19107  ORF Transcript_6333/g.19107 Transcript_6333/m.19107 type:complete len:2271 (+) Transcript_6333:269-7081(+)|eukprot:CAMPEP_0198735836 /NCGR_PEP_ID=MMETSP1475-20131203/61996_1 /TAXON_ID= ORGANISM="Unidentified sp., Strain CCMP1999" /NCGR_SAMPLE_ID=MMETSP1475 /ASSEMBLY_ACC=CAM_ASM_001111 /LENGTH=2270 /DNA_ID=CAMNT_0044499559 /DNA_START=254 /DNA_END=7066 /DNA_ORIENTATION=-
MVWVRTKKPIEPPQFMRDLVKRIASAATDDELCQALENFEAPYRFERSEERSLCNWIDVLNRIDEALDAAVKREPMVLLAASPQILSDEEVAKIEPSEANKKLIYLCLQATYKLISNSSDDTKNVYNSIEHLTALLADDDEKIILLCLDIVRTLLHRNTRVRPTRAHSVPCLGNRLLSLSRGWGGREAGLGLIDCCSASADSLPKEGASIRLEFVREDENSADGSLGTKGLISIDDVSTLPGDEKWFIQTYAEEQGLPRNFRFHLSVRYRRAKSFVNGLDSRLQYALIRLLALATVAQMQLTPEPLPVALQNEPELVSELVALTRADPADGLENLPLAFRVTALHCLTAISNHGQRLKQVLSAAGVSSHHGVLPSMLRSEISKLLSNSSAGEEQDTRADPMEITLAHTNGEVTHADFVEALLELVFTIAMAFPMSQGPTFLVMSGCVGTLLPILSEKNPANSKVVLNGIWALKCIIENTHASSGAAAFRENGGLTLVAQRIVEEICGDDTDDSEEADERLEREALAVRDESRELYRKLVEVTPPTVSDLLKMTAPSSSAASRGVIPQSKWALLRAILRLLPLAHRNSGGNTRELADGQLFRALRRLLARPFYYGGSLFAVAATVTADIVHREPTAASIVASSGLPRAILRSVKLGLPPSGDSIRCIPIVLPAICLSPTGLDEVLKSNWLWFYLIRLVKPFYGRAMHGETPVGIGTGLEELKRHHPALRKDMSLAFLSYLRHAADFVEVAGKYDSRTIDLRGPDGNSKSLTEVSALLDKLKLTVAHNAARLGAFAGHIVMESVNSNVTEFALTNLLSLRYAPAMAGLDCGNAHTSSRSTPTASSTLSSIITAIRNFPSSSRPAAIILRNLFEDSKRDAAELLSIGIKLGDTWLDEEGDGERKDCNESEAGPSRNIHVVGSEKLGHGGMADYVEIDIEFAARQMAKMEDELRRVSRSTNPDVPKVDEKFNSVSSRKELQRLLSESARRLRIDIVILSGIFRMPGYPTWPWASSSVMQLGSIAAAAERAARWHLARTYTGVTVEMAEEVDFFCTAKVTAMCVEDTSGGRAQNGEQSENQPTPHTAPGEGDESSKHKKVSANQNGRRSLHGLAWSLATLVASTERMYSIYARGLNAAVKRSVNRNSSRHTKTAVALASMIGRILAMHLVCASALWTKEGPATEQRKAPAAWDYLRGVLREIRSVLFVDTMRMSPSSTQPLVLQAFVACGGAAYLKRILLPEAFLSVVQQTSREDIMDLSGLDTASSTLQPRPPADNAITVGRQEGKPTSTNKEVTTIETLRRSAAVDVLESLGQLIHYMAVCPGLLNAPPNLAKYSDWKPRELHRTSQVLSIQAFESILKENQQLLESSPLREQLFSMTIPMVHTICNTREELEKNDDEANAAVVKEREELERHFSERLTASLPDNSMLNQLLDMGFSRTRAVEALRRAGHGGLLVAAEWLLSHPETDGREGGQAQDSDDSGGEDAITADRSESKDREMETIEDITTINIDEALRLSCLSDLEHLSHVLKEKVSKPTDHKILSMAKSILIPKFTEGGGDIANVEEMKTRPVTREVYKDAVESLFTTLRPLALQSLILPADEPNSRETVFLAVELSTSLDKASELDNASRNSFAETVVSQFHAAVRCAVSTEMTESEKAGPEVLKTVSAAKNSVIWTHFGGANAREALLNKQLVGSVMTYLRECARRQNAQRQSVNHGQPGAPEKTRNPFEDAVSEHSKEALKNGRSGRVIADEMLAVALLVLDGFIRHAKSDAFVVLGREAAKNADEEENNPTASGQGNAAGEQETAATEVQDESMTGEGNEGDEKVKLEQAEDELENAISSGVSTVLQRLSDMVPWPLSLRSSNCVDISDKKAALDICILLLESHQVESTDVLLALIQLLCSLTEDFELASEFLSRGGLQLLFSIRMPKGPHLKIVYGFLRTVIRHLVEDRETLTESMEQVLNSLLTVRRGSRILGLSSATLVASATPLLYRDLPAFVEAVGRVCRLRGGGILEVSSRASSKDTKDTPERKNVVTVVLALTEILSWKEKSIDEHYDFYIVEMTYFALRSLTELVELFAPCARALLNAKIPEDSSTSALDYVLQTLMPLTLMPLPAHPVMPMDAFMTRLNEKISDASRALFSALCDSTPDVQSAAVDALARACRTEAESDSPRPAMIKAVASCVSSSLKMQVIRMMLRSGLTVSLAKCLDKLDMNRRGTETANAVLKSLVLIGQTAANMPPDAAELDADADTSAGAEEMEDGSGDLDTGRAYVL